MFSFFRLQLRLIGRTIVISQGTLTTSILIQQWTIHKGKTWFDNFQVPFQPTEPSYGQVLTVVLCSFKLRWLSEDLTGSYLCIFSKCQTNCATVPVQLVMYLTLAFAMLVGTLPMCYESWLTNFNFALTWCQRCPRVFSDVMNSSKYNHDTRCSNFSCFPLLFNEVCAWAESKSLESATDHFFKRKW